MKKRFQNLICLISMMTLICSACSTATKQNPSEAFAPANKRSLAGQKSTLKYSKITGTLLKFDGSQRFPTGIAYSSQELKSDEHKIIIRSFENNKVIETVLSLTGINFLDFTSHSDDSRIPMISGHFFNSDYEDCILSATLVEQKLKINGVVTKLDQTHALSTKTMLGSSSGETIGIMQEKIELISAEEFEKATSSK